MSTQRDAPGRPGHKPRWTSGAKCGVGTALTASDRATSLVWFTLARGIFTEVFYPRPDTPCIRDLGLIVTDGESFFSEEQHQTTHEMEYVAEGVPAYRLTNTCQQGRYRIEKTIFAHSRHHVVLQETRFTPLKESLERYQLYVLVAPHLGGQGTNNTAWIGSCKGQTLLLAQRAQYALALACTAPWKACSAGYVGVSDGWQELHRHRHLTQTYERADSGNVALTGQVDLAACGGEFALALGLSADPEEAGLRARSSLQDNLKSARKQYVRGWREYQESLRHLDSVAGDGGRRYRISTAVMAVHEGKSLTGTVASLSVPWGMECGDDERLQGGYHLVWPRDLVETAGGLLAAGANDDAFRRLTYLQATQEADGRWPQNMWMNGSAFWTALQLCQVGMPVLLVDLLRREHAFDDDEHESQFWPMVRAAVTFILRHGPTTEEDRWERLPGYTPFTLAVVIAALLAAVDMAAANGDGGLAGELCATADEWNARIEGWLYVTGTDLARRSGVDGYYVRTFPPEAIEPASAGQTCVRLKGPPPRQNGILASEVVSPDALALVRFGLRAADDARIVNTLKVIDALLKVETPAGPVWHRFNGDDYGETSDGSPYPGHGKGGSGRAWPLLTGERAHYELAAGRPREARRLLAAMGSFANDGGMLPEQVWDTRDISQRGLALGRPTGSSMPLVWAHAEYVKLCRSLAEGRVFDMPTQTVARYLHKRQPKNRALNKGVAL